jgi:hypothetical protein
MPTRTSSLELTLLSLTAGFGFAAGFLAGWIAGKRNPVQPPLPPVRPPKVPDHFDETALASALALRLAGTPADGSAVPPGNADAVIWVDRGDEVLVHLNSVRTSIRDGVLLVSVDFETDQHGRTPLVMACAMGGVNDPAGLNVVTDDLPHGDGAMSSRWGKIMQQAVWGSLVGLAADHAAERFAAPLGISAAAGVLGLHAGAGPSATGAPPAGVR